MKKVKALVLLSGGLDSILAVKILKNQKIKVTGISFKSYFFGVETAKKAARNLKIPLKVVDFSKEHLKMVKLPRYGYGKSMNPCIDCHILMLKKAKEIMKKGGFDFVATGEVLGERPMSQNKKSLELIKEESSLKGYLLRPLSAKLFKPTIPEKKGWVNRKELLDISGRSRKRQIILTKKWKIKEYPTPAGGCLLTDLEFGKRLKELFKRYPNCNGNDIEFLKIGRHFFIGQIKIIVGRNEEENKEIEKLAQPKDILIEMKNYPGPLTLLRKVDREVIPIISLEKARKLTQYYSTRARNKKGVEFKIFIKTNKKSFKETIETILKFLEQGEVVICPTDTVYGLICDATDKKAVGELFKIKKRQKTKPIPIFVKNIKMAKRLAFIDKKQEEFLKKVWPGKVTVVLKTKPKAKTIFPKGILSSDNKVGLRIPDYKPIADLFKKFNKPLTGTSANISGKPASIKIKEILKQFDNQKNQPGLIVDAGNLRESKSSTVIDLTNKKAKILRKGEIVIK